MSINSIFCRSGTAILFAVLLGACSSVSQRHAGSLRGKSSSHLAASRDELGAALAEAHGLLAAGLRSPEEQQRYNAAVERSVALWLRLSGPQTRGTPVACSAVTGQSFTLRPAFDKDLLFDDLIPASKIKSDKEHHFTRSGIGAPMVAAWKGTPERRKTELFMSEVGYVEPVTATLDFQPAGPNASVATLMLEDPRDHETVRIAGGTRTLAADWSAPAQYAVSQKGVGMSAMGALMNTKANIDKLGLIALERPKKDRIPVIFVHGLMSRPLTWLNVSNVLGSDPVVHERYQFYFFRYPSGLPVIFTAAKLRQSLGVLHNELERQGNSTYGHQMVFVGHSMGGLVSKSQVQSSGDRIWISLFGTTPDKLHLTPEELQTLKSYLEFQPNQYISRVVFVCTPHRGSPMANRSSIFGKLAGLLIRLPGKALGSVHDIVSEQAKSNSVLNKLVATGIPTSVDNLSDKSRFVQTSISLPLRPGLHVHSIIGNQKGLALTDPKCSDGIVPYTSAHLDGVESELVVRSGHSAQENPEAQAELRRILLLHLKEL